MKTAMLLVAFLVVASVFACGDSKSSRRPPPADELNDPTPNADEKGGPREFPVEGTWIPSGWMGDAADPKLKGVLVMKRSEENPYEGPACQKWAFDPSKGAEGWVAVAFQFPENNWGEKPGKSLRGKGFKRITFAARGERGGEKINFISGGHTKDGAKYPASYEEEKLEGVELDKTWKVYSIPVKDLSNVVCAFAFATNQDMNPRGCTFYIDDIKFTD